jgi:hypothetical protein
LIQYNLYKGVGGVKPGKKTGFGAIQFSLKQPDLSADLKDMRPGVVFVNACSSVGPNKYNWDNKFVFALGLPDIGKILHFFISAGEGESLNLVHDPHKGGEASGQVIKNMNFYTKSGCLNGCMITCSIKEEKESISHKIPVSGDEVIVLKTLLEAAIPAILGWS